MALGQLFEIGDIVIGNTGADSNTILAQLEAQKAKEEAEEKKKAEERKRKILLWGGVITSIALIALLIYLIKQKLNSNER